jgi:hypothetical protein
MLVANIVFLFLSVVREAPSDGAHVHRWTLDGGGTMSCTGGMLELSGTIGQADAGLMTGGGLELSGGFWFAPSAADCNVDGCVDLVDYAAFPVCMTGPNEDVPTHCACNDLDHDGDLDLSDVAGLQRVFTGT